jgi:hypothetical protein
MNIYNNCIVMSLALSHLRNIVALVTLDKKVTTFETVFKAKAAAMTFKLIVVVLYHRARFKSVSMLLSHFRNVVV